MLRIVVFGLSCVLGFNLITEGYAAGHIGELYFCCLYTFNFLVIYTFIENGLSKQFIGKSVCRSDFSP